MSSDEQEIETKTREEGDGVENETANLDERDEGKGEVKEDGIPSAVDATSVLPSEPSSFDPVDLEDENASIDTEIESIDHSAASPEIGMQPYDIPFDEVDSESFSPKRVRLKADPEGDAKLEQERKRFIFGLCVVDFHHVRGPELEYWIDDSTTDGNEADQIRKFSRVWPQLPFQALPDGAHLFDETFSNFTLTYDDIEECCPELPIERQEIYEVVDGEGEEEDVDVISEPFKGLTTLFGCACIRQLDTDKLKQQGKSLHQQEGFTRSVIQKSVVLITRYPITIQLKEKLSIITKSYFDQLDFSDKSIIKALYDNVSLIYNSNGYHVEDDELYESADPVSHDLKDSDVKIIKESDFYVGLNLKQLVNKLKRKLLVIYKSLLLEQRILIFCRDLNTLSNVQYSLLSLIPNLLMNLSDSGSPLLDKLSRGLRTPTSLKSSDRRSMLEFIGLPLQLFNRGGFFQPYITLQQLDYFGNKNTGWFLAGSSNDILLEHKKDWFDMIVYINEGSEVSGGAGGGNGGGGNNGSAIDFIFREPDVKLEILSKDLKDKILLTSQDKKFIDHVINEVEKNNKLMEGEEEKEGEGEDGGISKTVNNNLSMDSGRFRGGDDYIRYQFEDYLIGMLSSIKYDRFLKANESKLDTIRYLNLNEFENQVNEFNLKFIGQYKGTKNYEIFEKYTEDELFNFFDPVHVGKVIKDEGAGAMIRGLFSGWGGDVGEEGKKGGDEKKKEDGAEKIDGKEVKVENIGVRPTLGESVANVGASMGNFFRRIREQ
ncbi:DEKNAAC102741 [Brettanomyces naardenensis]|uniref:DEKNAAC102741 n=1 Tax=Brettanomyces naardenensis TaxID=13370 RepID=A0A448YLF3_BRENA|nr:DEKNAAC102741 [Brettanomyces naardenensis]